MDKLLEYLKLAKGTVENTVEKKILRAMKENPKITIMELTKQTGLTRRGVEWNIDKLKKKAK